ncbi:hypothetical protein J7E73_25160, partial [Paenibacillus albidus]|uniref:hypothetical protein n=1 Tax=Paenibacillus albidus TaxID=2041023 RepID=UPI001BE6EB80
IVCIHALIEMRFYVQTFIDEIIDVVNQAYDLLLSNLAADHTSYDIAKYIKDVGSRVETFLKEGIYNNTRNRDTFEVIVNDIAPLGLSRSSIESLHELRKKYNKAKHDPSTFIRGLEAIKIIQDTNAALIEMKTLGLGGTSRVQSYERVLWIAGWDHITSGETEISIMIPSALDERMPPSIDFFNITCRGWEPLITKFVTQGQLLMGKEYFPAKVYDFLNVEDFLDAGIFIGNYRNLILEISKYVDLKQENKLLPNLQRKNDPISIYYAMVYATCDVISEGMFIDNQGELEDAILIIASYKYAVEITSEFARKLVPSMANILMRLKDEHRNKIEGPFFLTEENFNIFKKISYFKSEQPPIIVTKDGKLYSLLV